MRIRLLAAAGAVSLVTWHAASAGEPVVLTDAQLDQASAAGTITISTRYVSVSNSTEVLRSDGTVSVSRSFALAFSKDGEHSAQTSGDSTSTSVTTSGTATASGGTKNRAVSKTTVKQAGSDGFRVTSSTATASAGEGGSTAASSFGFADTSSNDVAVVLQAPVAASAVVQGDAEIVSAASSASTGTASMESRAFATSASALIAVAAN